MKTTEIIKLTETIGRDYWKEEAEEFIKRKQAIHRKIKTNQILSPYLAKEASKSVKL